MNHNYRSKVDSLLDNDGDISNPQAQQRRVTNHAGDSYARVFLLILPDGNEKFLHYSYLVDADFQIETGSIVLNFTSHVVTLRGLRLHGLYRDLSRHLPHTITVVDERYASLAGPAEPIVTFVEIVAK